MNPLWLILIFPSYAFLGGFTGARIHHGKGHNRLRCDNGRDAPWCLFGGILWPLIIPVMVMYMAVMFGVNVEAMRPARRKEKAREVTRANEKEVYGRVLSEYDPR